jgi:predicted XRE-type DNA-binding protein
MATRRKPELHPLERELRLQLMRGIAAEIRAREWDTADAADYLNIKRPEVSYMMNGHADRASVRQLLGWADQLGVHFELTATPISSQ